MANLRIQVLLKKIETILLSDDSISRLEKDLVKGYLRELYELVESTQADTNTGTSEEILVPPLRNHRAETRTMNLPDPAELLQNQEVEKILGPEKIHQESRRAPEPAHPGVTINGQTEVRNVPQKEVEAEKITHSRVMPELLQQRDSFSGKYHALFETGKGQELSERLARIPVKDLNKAFSINDRLQIITELFGGSQQIFTETLDILNTKYSFDEARSYLIRYVVDNYRWLDEEKFEKARDFVKIVERRYLD